MVLTFDIPVITLSRINTDFIGENVQSFRKWRSAIKYFQAYENQSDIWTEFWRQIHDQAFISWLKRSQCNTLFKCQYVGTSFTWTSVLFSSGSANLKEFHKYIILLWHPGSLKVSRGSENFMSLSSEVQQTIMLNHFLRSFKITFAHIDLAINIDKNQEKLFSIVGNSKRCQS